MNFDIPARISDLVVFAAEKLLGLGWISSDVRGATYHFFLNKQFRLHAWNILAWSLFIWWLPLFYLEIHLYKFLISNIATQFIHLDMLN